jgi:hypothetical protein
MALVPSSSALGSSALRRLLNRKRPRPRRSAKTATPPIAMPAIAPTETDALGLWAAPWAAEPVAEEGLEPVGSLVDSAPVGMPVVAGVAAVPIIIAGIVVAADVAVADTVAVDIVVAGPVAADVGSEHDGGSCVKAHEIGVVGSWALESGVVGFGVLGIGVSDERSSRVGAGAGGTGAAAVG